MFVTVTPKKIIIISSILFVLGIFFYPYFQFERQVSFINNLGFPASFEVTTANDPCLFGHQISFDATCTPRTYFSANYDPTLSTAAVINQLTETFKKQGFTLVKNEMKSEMDYDEDNLAAPGQLDTSHQIEYDHYVLDFSVTKHVPGCNFIVVNTQRVRSDRLSDLNYIARSRLNSLDGYCREDI
jgi:hypothetical protein